MIKIKKIILLIIIACSFILISTPSYAGNNDSLPSYGYTGTGDDLWKYNYNYSGMRISIYWAPNKEAFELGTSVIQLGNTVDISKTGPWYKVEEYTGYSVYWYMNKNKQQEKVYNSTRSINAPYSWVGKGEIYNLEGQDIVQAMPDVWNGTKEQWDNWFEGPIINGNKTYKNIPEISMLCNTYITTEDFINGICCERGFMSSPGVYKIFFEPVIYPIIDGAPMAMTLRDLIRWEEAFWQGDLNTSDGKDLINWITPVFVFTSNSQFLIENEPAICMYGKSSILYKDAFLKTNYLLFGENISRANSYNVVYESPDINIRRQQRAEIKNQLNPLGGIIYNSMGVGVITTAGENKEQIVIIDDQEEKSESINQDSTAILKAAARGHEPFDVTKGIPSNEPLYAQIIADSYLYRLIVNHVDGYAGTVVTVNHVDEDGNPATSSVLVNKSYSYYEITSFELYSIKDAQIENDALAGNKVLITPSSGYSPPHVEITHQTDDKYTYHVTGYSSSKTISSQAVTPSEVHAAAQAAVSSPRVRSDKLVINGKTIMDAITGSVATDVKPEKTDQDMLFKTNLLIDEKTLNGLYESKGSITYHKMYSFNPKNPDTLAFELENINSVFVHTPVCANLTVSSDEAYNQNPSPVNNASALILGRPFTLDITNAGNHRNIKGYKDKDYTKYIKDREVRFGFDTYLGKDRTGIYLKANTWHSLKDLGIANSSPSILFYTPAWVDSGTYSIEFRNIATNNTSNNGASESKANINPSNTIAACEKKVEVSGRIYDFSITDIDDISWESFFRTTQGSSNSTKKTFYIGPTDVNGNLNASRKYFFPVIPGKNDVPGYQNRAIKLGYAFKFEVKTIGNFYDNKDYLKINPTFTFVDKDGNNRQQVDLYYQTPYSPLIKVGGSQDTLCMPVSLDFKYRGINISEFQNTAGAMYRLRGGIKDYTQDKWIDSFPKLSTLGVPTYKYTEILLTEPLRSFIGPKNNIPNGVSIDKAFASAHKWYGEYSLPSDCLIVPHGTDLSKEKNLTKNSQVFLKEGYLIVNFKNMSVGKNMDFNNPYVQYTGKTGDGWVLEGYNTNQGGWQLINGDVLAYYANMRATDDYTGTGTH